MKLKVIKEIQSVVKKQFDIDIEVELTPSKGHGDFSTNVAMKLTKELKKNPREIAETITSNFNLNFVDKTEIAGPGFINIFIKETASKDILENILKQGNKYGSLKQNKKINVEYVSANPTGFLHIGHARGAALGATLVNVLRFAGNKVDAEYYINDAGNQIDTLGQATFIRYQQELGKDVKLPEDSYHGQDIVFIAKELIKELGDKYKDSSYEDVEELFKEKARLALLEIIKEHLAEFGVKFDLFSSEKELYEDGSIDKALEKIKKHTFEKDGALWLKTIINGDDKDRVLIKSDGKYTYFLPDIAYHNKKLNRGYDELINVWGADHIGYIKRMEIALGYLGLPKEKLDVITIQMVRLMKDGKEMKMSKRLGTAFTLHELMELVGKDATRFYMIDRSNNSQFDFNVDLATKQSSENPVFTIQYAHARCNQLLEKGKEPKVGTYQDKAKDLFETITKFPNLIETIANTHKVHLLPKYLIDLTREFNSFYSNTKIIGSEQESELLALVKATKITIANSLALMNIDAPNKM